MSTESCSVEGCDRARDARDYCNAHWKRWRKTGAPGPAKIREKRAGRVCSVDGCDSPHSGRGYCNAHRQRTSLGKSPGSAAVQPARGRRTSRASYSTAHRWVVTVRGEPALHSCAECGGGAAEWAYDHRDPNELKSPKGPYSLDAERYRPMCKPCHRKFDADFWRPRRQGGVA